ATHILYITSTPEDSIFFFFFSSRRRHTRFSRDWSSDVCSSDLDRMRFGDSFACGTHRRPCAMSFGCSKQLVGLRQRDGQAEFLRSEERRVGKECRSRWSAGHEKKKGVRGEQITNSCVPQDRDKH